MTSSQNEKRKQLKRILFEIFAKMRKYPTAAGAMVLAAILSFLLTTPAISDRPAFFMLWLLSVLVTLQTWWNFRGDRSYRVSGIVPAWLELIAGFAVLLLCPAREISIILVLLAVCSYAAGIIFSMKMTFPLILLIGIAPRLNEINALIHDAMALITDRVWMLGNVHPELPEYFPGTAELCWALMLAIFPGTVAFCRSAYDRFSAYCMAIPLFILMDLLRVYLFGLLKDCMDPLSASQAAFWGVLLLGVAVSGTTLKLIDRFSLPEKTGKKGVQA